MLSFRFVYGFVILFLMQVQLCCDDAVLWGALGVALMCSTQTAVNSAHRASVDRASVESSSAVADSDVGGHSWLAETIARAHHCFCTAAKIDDHNVDNFCNFAVFNAEIACDYVKAKHLFAKALHINPDHAETILNYANLLDSLEEHEQAMRLLRSGVASHPLHPRMLACLADSIVKCGGDFEEARDYFSRAIESKLGSSDAMLLAAYADFLMDVFGDSKAAAAAYAKAADLVQGKGQVDVLVRLVFFVLSCVFSPIVC